MVPTAGVEPAQVAPLAPQTSASTNFATSACHALRATRYGVRGRTPSTLRRCAPVRKTLSLNKNTITKTLSLNDYRLNDYFLNDYFAGAAGFGAAGAGAAGCVAAWA